MKRPNLISVSAAGVLRLAGVFPHVCPPAGALVFRSVIRTCRWCFSSSVTAARQPVTAVITGIACLFLVVMRPIDILGYKHGIVVTLAGEIGTPLSYDGAVYDRFCLGIM